jgi:hypothetical protein
LNSIGPGFAFSDFVRGFGLSVSPLVELAVDSAGRAFASPYHRPCYGRRPYRAGSDMADLSSRPYADSYSGLVNQAIAACIVVSLAFGGHELMKRQRRGDRVPAQGLGSVETWGFG